MVLRKAAFPAVLWLGLSIMGSRASAQLDFHVNVDTSNLTAGQTYYAEFTLGDGMVASSGTPDMNNSVMLNNFMFGAGTPGAVLSPNVGNASGNFSSGIVLADGDAGGVADLAQAFMPGAFLSFDAHLPTTNVDSGGIPDHFSVEFLNSAQTAFTTSSPGGTNQFIQLDFSNPSLTAGNVKTFAGNDPSNNALIPAPVVTPIGGPTPTPEFGSLFSLGGLLAAGGTGLWLKRRRLQGR